MVAVAKDSPQEVVAVLEAEDAGDRQGPRAACRQTPRPDKHMNVQHCVTTRKRKHCICNSNTKDLRISAQRTGEEEGGLQLEHPATGSQVEPVPQGLGGVRALDQEAPSGPPAPAPLPKKPSPPKPAEAGWNTKGRKGAPLNLTIALHACLALMGRASRRDLVE